MSYNTAVERVGVRELNQQTSRVIERVRRGQAVEITDRGRPIARLVPVPVLSDFLDQLVVEGRVVPATLPGKVPMPPDSGDTDIDVAAALAATRDEEER